MADQVPQQRSGSAPYGESVKLLVVGGGPAGYTAALYGARSGLAPVCIEGFDAGGQITRSFLVENFPGAPDGTSGADLMNRIREQASGFGARLLMDDVVSVDLASRPFHVATTSHAFLADALIVATGSKPRSLGLPGEEDLVGRGIAYCALCDGPFFAGVDVVVVGGGNAALGEAMAMARVASRVTVVHRRDGFRADDVVERAARDTPGIEILTPYVVGGLVATPDGDLAAVRLRNVETGSDRELATAGLFIAIGHEPARRWSPSPWPTSSSTWPPAATTTATPSTGSRSASPCWPGRSPSAASPPASLTRRSRSG
jgi:thioredoxin reductase (NADPH)